MSDWRKPVYASGRFELAFWSDVGKGIGESLYGMVNAKIPTLIMLGLCVLDAWNVKVPMIGLMEEAAVVFVSYGMIRKVWCELNAQNPNFTAEEFKGVETKMVGVSYLYGIYCFLWGLLLIVPGIWWGVKNCLAVVVAAVENLKPVDCLKRSEELVKGHFWKAFRYAFGGPFLLFLALLAISVGMGVAVDLLPKSAQPIFLNAVAFIGEALACVWQLVTIALLVRLYADLRWHKEVAAADPVNKGFTPSEPRWEK